MKTQKKIILHCVPQNYMDIVVARKMMSSLLTSDEDLYIDFINWDYSNIRNFYIYLFNKKKIRKIQKLLKPLFDIEIVDEDDVPLAVLLLKFWYPMDN